MHYLMAWLNGERWYISRPDHNKELRLVSDLSKAQMFTDTHEGWDETRVTIQAMEARGIITHVVEL